MAESLTEHTLSHPEVLPLTNPVIDLSLIAGALCRAAGQPVTRGVDFCRRELSDYAKFLAYLGSYHGGTTLDALKTLRHARTLQSHLSFSFLIVGSRDLIFQIAERSGLHVTAQDNSAVVSGTLAQWQAATFECCRATQPFELRLAFDKVVLVFDQQFGLGEIWHDYSKKSTDDGTFILEHRGP